LEPVKETKRAIVSDDVQEQARQRVVPALVAAAAVAVVVMLTWDAIVWAFVYGHPETVGHVITGILFGYIPAQFLTFAVAGPAWLLLDRLGMKQRSLFVVVGALIGFGLFYFVSGPRIRSVRPPFLVAPLVAGAFAGVVLHRVGYGRKAP
jgi:hypothetical protein